MRHHGFSCSSLYTVTPEQAQENLLIEHYLTRALEQAYRFGEKPVTPAIMTMTLAPDMHGLEPTLTRYGYTIHGLAELLNIRPTEVRTFLHGQLPPGRTEELHRQLLAAGIPLSDRLAATPPAPAERVTG
jgi:hypothetical protein